MFDQLEYQTIVLGALLHDIGKLLQRGSFGALDIKGQHPKVSADFIAICAPYFEKAASIDLLKTLVQRHHENSRAFPPDLLVQGIHDPYTRTLAALVSLADNLSSSERGQRLEQWQDFKFTPLAPVLQRVQVGEEVPAGGQADGLSHFRAQPAVAPGDAAMAGVFPQGFVHYAAGELNALLTAFGPEFRDVFGKVDGTQFEVVLCHLLNFLQKYTWCIPSNTQEAYPDVSLFDHLRGTAAIASCLYRFHVATDSLDEPSLREGTRPRFCLIVGDLSGIQRYIFHIAAVGVEGGVARRLRARSLYVQLLTEVAAQKLLRAAKLPLVHLLMASGGKFYILAPNSAEVRAAVAETRQAIEAWLLDQFNGEISLNLELETFGDEGFKATQGGATGFGRVLRGIHTRLAERKLRALAARIADNGWNPAQFVMRLHYQGEDACISCRRLPRQRDNVCEQCARDRDLGAELPTTNYIAFFSDPGVGSIPVLGESVSLWEQPPPSGAQPYLVLQLNATRFDRITRFPAQFRYLATHVPVRADGSPVTFEELAQRSQGRPLLGFLKADVDRLGEVMAFGLRRLPPDYDVDTVSRTVTLSRQLDWFFSGWVQHLLRTEFADCYTVYSGGDDLFLVGPWERVLLLAERVRDDFQRYTCNPRLTLSAGVVIARPDYPIARAAGAADELLARAKRAGRDRIAVLGDCLPWADWQRVGRWWQQVADSGELGRITSAFLYSLLEYAQLWQDYRQHNNVLGLRFQPLLAYNLARNLDPRQTPLLCDWAKGLTRLRPSDAGQTWMLDHLGLMAQLLILSAKGRANDDRTTV